MAQQLEKAVPTLQEAVANAERRLAGLRKDVEERRKWLANNVPDLNNRLATPATRALFATKLCGAIEVQPLEVISISADQLVQNLGKELEDLQTLMQHKKAEIQEAKVEQRRAEEEVELLVRLRNLRRDEGEMRHEERLADKFASANRQFKQHRKWLVTMINDLFADNDEMSDLLMELTSAYFSDGDPYVAATTNMDRMTTSLLALISSGIVSRHPYEPDRVRLQDLS